MPQFSGRLAGIRITPSRSEDADTVVRLLVEAHDITIDELAQLVGKDTLVVHMNLRPAPATPLEQAIIEAPPALYVTGYEDATPAEVIDRTPDPPTTNGRHEEPALPSNTRRRRGTHADPTEGE